MLNPGDQDNMSGSPHIRRSISSPGYESLVEGRSMDKDDKYLSYRSRDGFSSGLRTPVIADDLLPAPSQGPQTRVYRRGSVLDTTPSVEPLTQLKLRSQTHDGATLQVPRRVSTPDEDDDDMDQAFADYRNREKRRRSSYRVVAKDLAEAQPQSTDHNVAIIAVFIGVILLIVILLAFYVRQMQLLPRRT